MTATSNQPSPNRTFEFSILDGQFAAVRLDPDSSVPSWAMHGLFFSITRTPDELSIICAASNIPSYVQPEQAWAALKIHGPFPLSEVGVLAQISSTLASVGVSILAISTFETDHLLVQLSQLKQAVAALEHANHKVYADDSPS